jgi:hypothetical protein
VLRLGQSSRFLSLQFSDLGSSCRDELCVGVRVATKTPSAVRRLGQKDPGAVGERGVTGRVRKREW